MKSTKYLNIGISSSLYDRFATFCRDNGMSKTGAVEKAITLYMDSMQHVMHAVENDMKEKAGDDGEA